LQKEGDGVSMISDLLNNFILQSVFAGWFIAQLLKTIIHAVLFKTFKPERLIGAGGMPSSHSASVAALATSAGLQHGLDSFPFSMSLIFAIIVMHDAQGVRKETGEHARILNRMIIKFHTHDKHSSTELKLKEFVGHTSLQVFVGAIIGILAALMIHYSS
jgi:uncharacterized protein